eukprot:2132251-Rhodomonas_salina.3
MIPQHAPTAPSKTNQSVLSYSQAPPLQRTRLSWLLCCVPEKNSETLTSQLCGIEINPSCIVP